MVFYTHGSTEDLQPRMLIKYDGNVGIGTTSPTEKIYMFMGIMRMDMVWK